MAKVRFSDRLYKMVIAAMLAALTALLTFTPIGMIPLPPPLPNATTVHIPVIVAALTEGWAVGLFVGLTFGVCSLIKNWTASAGLSLFFRNPLVSVLPRLLIPIAAILIYMLWKKTLGRGKAKDTVGAAISAVFATAVNTVGCLGMIALIYGNELTELVRNIAGADPSKAQYMDHAGEWLVAAVGLPNGIAECILAALLVPAIKLAVDAVRRRSANRH